GFGCPAHRFPAASDFDAVVETSGVRSTPMVPRSALPSLPPGRQSLERPLELVVVHESPVRAPRSQLPTPGLAGDPVAEQRGQGCAGAPVMKMCEASGTPSESPPVLLSRVPLPASAKVLMTHVERFPFGIGSGGPKLHPTSVQSMPPPPPLVGARSQML